MPQRQPPKKPLRICTHPGCNNLTTERYCQKCAPKHIQNWIKKREFPRISGRKLQKARKRLFKERPHCENCLKQGKYSLATERDHIIPLSQGGPDAEENIQALCKECHDRKSKNEQKG
ncbi:HNH endonuclease [Candidatus Parcubacteria bacterium]|nr:MAG: HNH endonuclease [Candidatus Parcubacteria bacterium]